jgi:hypothetical protein
VAGGEVTTGIGGIWLGNTRTTVKRALGLPSTESARFVTYCFDGGGRLVAGFAGGDRAQLVLTDASPFDTHGVRVGMSSANARRHLFPHSAKKRKRHHARSAALKRKRHRKRAFKVPGAMTKLEKKRRLLVGISRGRVSYLAVAPRRLAAKSIVAYLKALPK